VIGVSLAAGIIYALRASPPPPPEKIIVKSEPEIRYVEAPAPPPPEPEVIIVEVPVAPPVQKIEVKSAWDGIWRQPKYPLPMFELKQSGACVTGRYVPNWSEITPLTGKVEGNTVEVLAANEMFRSHFRLKMQPDGKAAVEGWLTEEDWLFGLANANRKVRTPQEALQARAILEDAGKRLGKASNIGTFIRGGEVISALENNGELKERENGLRKRTGGISGR
jgi:hypothetical protein